MFVKKVGDRVGVVKKIITIWERVLHRIFYLKEQKKISKKRIQAWEESYRQQVVFEIEEQVGCEKEKEDKTKEITSIDDRQGPKNKKVLRSRENLFATFCVS